MKRKIPKMPPGFRIDVEPASDLTSTYDADDIQEFDRSAERALSGLVDAFNELATGLWRAKLRRVR